MLSLVSNYFLKEKTMKPSYTAIVLDPESQKKLLAMISTEGWELPVAHHMTINMGEVEKGPIGRNYIGQKVIVNVISLAKSESAMAVGVNTEIPSSNRIKHITVALNPSLGGKAKDSNNLDNWIPIPNFKLSGEIREVGQNNIIL